MQSTPTKLAATGPWRLSVAPMLDWTDRHCRYFLRQLSRGVRLYTEMVNTGALLHGDVAHHLDFDACEYPLALQLGGNDPHDLAACSRLAERWGYGEVNLNCGCPSDRVQQGAFGVCLMRDPHRVADCVRAMTDACTLPVSVKHRIGIDRDESYGFVRDFVGIVSQRGGCRVFIVHARNAWLKGLSPKENRDIPPLRYEVAEWLQRDFPELTIVVNGGLSSSAQIEAHWQLGQGVMVGRAAYHNPWWLSEWDALLGRAPDGLPSREAVELAMCDYMQQQALLHGTPWHAIARHMLGLRLGLPGARHWRQVWSDHRLQGWAPHAVMERAHERGQSS